MVSNVAKFSFIWVVIQSALFATSLSSNEKAILNAFMKPVPNVADNKNNPVTEAKVALGKRLFLEEALSNPKVNNGNKVSCNTCHMLDKFGIDGHDRSIGILGTKVPVNAPTVYNAALHFKQFWNGRAKDVEEQALGPITAVKEMGFTSSDADKNTVLKQLVTKDANYPKLFAKAFPGEKDAFTFDNIGNAIGAFERTLITKSKFDDFLNGRAKLNIKETKGLKLFLTAGGSGCVSCHNGEAVGGSQFRMLGERVNKPIKGDLIAEEAFKDIPSPLKVPSLLNIEKTGPYFHNGTVKTLDEAIRIMGKYQLGVDFSKGEISELKAFLSTMTAHNAELVKK